MSNNLPVIDLHCDLLSYLETVPKADPFNKGEIGCSLPFLSEGNVGLQVMAIFTSKAKGSATSAFKQSLIFNQLLNDYSSNLQLIKEAGDLKSIAGSPKIGMLAAIENASGLCEEDDSLDVAFQNLERIISNTGRVLYITMTHHTENRFGGGNYSKPGLKDDGKVLLEYLDGKHIAIDFSHTSDALAYDLLDYLSKKSLNIPVMASHSNYRRVFSHPRNLPDEIAKEIIRQKGLIGINFMRAFLNDNDPNAMYDHIDHGLALGGEDSICFGADFFHTDSHPDPSRKPFYHRGQENASCYHSILSSLSEHLSPDVVEGISNKNVINYLNSIWTE